MNTTHTQAIGLPASIGAKFVMLTNIVNASIATPRRIVYTTNSVSIDENTTFNVYEINKGLLCFDVTIDTALITLRELNIPSLDDNSEYQFNIERFASIERD